MTNDDDDDDTFDFRRNPEYDLIRAKAEGLYEGMTLAQQQMEAKSNPLLVLKERARKLRRVMRMPEKPTGDVVRSAADHAHMLDLSFRSMMLDGDGTTLGEKDAIALALRTQQQFVRACYLLQSLEEKSAKRRQTRQTDY